MRKKLTQEEVISRFRKVHGDKYDYPLVKYDGIDTKVKIMCPTHGVFEQTPWAHIKGDGCRKCAFVTTSEDFAKKANTVHGYKYDYSRVKYINQNEKVEIVCPIHGSFWQEPRKHLEGCGCVFCGYESESAKKTKSNKWFLDKAKHVHGDLYDYSKVRYKGTNEPVEIICKKHGLFLQKPRHHLDGAGCPVCKCSNGEEKISLFLKQNNILFIPQYKIHNEYLFCGNKKMFVDFYLPDYNMFIEYNGSQHYYKNDFWGGIESFKKQQERDNAVRQYCKNHSITLVTIPFTKFDEIDNILKSLIKQKTV